MPELAINFRVDQAQLIERLHKGQRRLAYAVVNAVNNTSKRIQTQARERVQQRFEVRKKTLMYRQAAIIKPFANVRQRRAHADIAVGQKPRLLLSRFERGGEREPFTPGAERVAVPVVGGPARPRFSDPVPPEFRMRRLKFGRTKRGKHRAGVRKTRTYLVPSTGIFQRVGPNRRDTRLVYYFAKVQTLEDRLEFVKSAQELAAVWFPEEMEREAVNAIGRARGRS